MKIDDATRAAIERWYNNWAPEGPRGDLSKALFTALKEANRTPQERNVEKFDMPWRLDIFGHTETSKGYTIGHHATTRPLAVAAPEMAELLAELSRQVTPVMTVIEKAQALLDRIGWER